MQTPSPLSISRLRQITWFVFFLTLIAGIALPIYVDEVGWRMVDSRFWSDGSLALSLYPHCQTDSGFYPPRWWLPFLSLRQALFSFNPSLLRFRLFGVVSAFFAVGLAAAILRNLRFGSRVPLALLLPIFFATGTMPMLLILNRTEPAMIVMLLVAVRLSLKRTFNGLSVLLLLLFSTLLSTHAKSAFSIFVFFGLLLFSQKKHGRAKILVFISIAAGLTVSSSWYWMNTRRCETHDAERKIFRALVLTFQDFRESPLNSLCMVFKNLFSLPAYIDHIRIAARYSCSWLPPTIKPLVTISNFAGSINFIFIAVACLAVSYSAIVYLSRRFSKFTWHRKVFCIGLIANLAAQSIFQSSKPFYESSWVSTLFFCLGIASFPVWGCWGKKIESQWYVAPVIYGSTLFSLVVLWVTLFPSLWGERLVEPYTPQQYLSAGVFSDLYYRRVIRGLEVKCGLDKKRPLNHLVIDSSTYTYFNEITFQPFHINYLHHDIQWKNDDLRKFLAEQNSDGLVTSCRRIPPNLRSAWVKIEPLCCLPAFAPKQPPTVPN